MPTAGPSYTEHQAVSELPAAADPAVGLCSVCRHARRSTNARGSTFWQCRAARDNAELRRYPELPIRSCGAFEQGPDEG